jgi:hypothetical protein
VYVVVSASRAVAANTGTHREKKIREDKRATSASLKELVDTELHKAFGFAR